MANPSDFADRLTALIPHWLAWPVSALSMLMALAGAILVFSAAAFASIAAAIWSVIAFAGAAIAWHVADYADGNG